MQNAVDRAEEDKRALESNAAEQAKMFEAFKAQSSASSADTTRLKELEKELDEVKKDLAEVNDVLERTRMAESTQRVALLDELNSLQQENGNLRTQLRRNGGK